MPVAGEYLAQRGRIVADIRGILRLGRTHEERVAEGGELGGQVVAAEDVARGELLEHATHGTIEPQDRLVEARPVEREAHARDSRERRDELVGTGMRGRGDTPQA